MTMEGGILNFVTSHFKNSIKAILHISTKLKQFHSFINIIQFLILLMFCIFMPMFDLILIYLKNNLNGNKNNFGIAVFIY